MPQSEPQSGRVRFVLCAAERGSFSCHIQLDCSIWTHTFQTASVFSVLSGFNLFYDSILQSIRTYMIFFTKYMTYVTANIIISVLFSCRIQLCIGNSYSVDCCLCWAGSGWGSAQKERGALMFFSCQRSSPLPLSLTQPFSYVCCHYFCFSSDETFSDVEVASCRLQCEGCSAFSFCCHYWVFKRLWEGEKKDLGSLLGSSFSFGLEGNLGHGMCQNKKKVIMRKSL